MQSLETTNGQNTKYTPIYDQTHNTKVRMTESVRSKSQAVCMSGHLSDCWASQIVIQEARSDQLWWSHQVLPQWYVHLVPHLDWEPPGKYFLHKKLHSQVQTEKTTCIPTYAQNHNIKTGFDWICWKVLQFAQDIFLSLNVGKLRWRNLHYITTFRIITLSNCDDSHQVLLRSYVQLVAI